MTTELMTEARSLVESYAKSDLFRSETQLDEITVEWSLFRIANSYVEGGTIVDLGGGYNFTNAALAKLGMTVHCVDMMDDYFVHSSLGDTMREQFLFVENEGVNFTSADVLEFDAEAEFGSSSLDVVTSYHCLEHLHHSPKKMLTSAMEALKSNGELFLEVPNAVNVLKRIKVLVGKSNYLSYGSYYDSEKYYLHIREYTTGDLEQLANNLDLKDWEIFGTNYYGNLWNSLGVNPGSRALDSALRRRPGLCGAIHLKGKAQ